MTIDPHRAHAAGLAAFAAHLPGGLSALPATAGPLGRLGRTSLAAQFDLFVRHDTLAPDRWTSGDAIIDRTGAVPRHRWLLSRWIAALHRAGAIEYWDGGWRACPDDRPVAEGDLFADYAMLGFPERLARFHRAALDHLDALLRDRISLPSLLFPDGRILEALAAYQRNPFTSYANATCAEWVRQCPASGPHRRILELGGGPGQTTGAVLRALREQRVEYLFTDLSRLFTHAIAQNHPARPGLRHALLDIDGDFAAQGVARGSMDVVVAGNVLHNARDIDHTLRSIRTTLAPGGRLVFTEAMMDNPVLLTSMQFLLSPASDRSLPGGGDVRAATGEVFLDAERWHERLAVAGFVVDAMLPGPADPDLVRGGQHVFLARVAEAAA